MEFLTQSSESLAQSYIEYIFFFNAKVQSWFTVCASLRRYIFASKNCSIPFLDMQEKGHGLFAIGKKIAP